MSRSSVSPVSSQDCAVGRRACPRRSKRGKAGEAGLPERAVREAFLPALESVTQNSGNWGWKVPGEAAESVTPLLWLGNGNSEDMECSKERYKSDGEGGLEGNSKQGETG